MNAKKIQVLRNSLKFVVTIFSCLVLVIVTFTIVKVLFKNREISLKFSFERHEF